MDAIPLSNLVPTLNPQHYHVSFINFLEDHLEYIKNNTIDSSQIVPAYLCDKYRGDFYGLLKYLNVPQYMHYITMRINDLTNSFDFVYDQFTLYQMNESKFNNLFNTYITKKIT